MTDTVPAALSLVLIPGAYAVCRLGAQDPVPAWIGAGRFSSVTRTADELSIICAAEQVPAHVHHTAGWRVLQLIGPFPFTATGVLESLLAPLASAHVPVLAVATFDTDYLLIQSPHLATARRAWHAVGHGVLEGEPAGSGQGGA